MKIFQRIFILFMFILTLSAIFISNTRPIDDGDTWFQMAYGKYMVEQGTLIPDHTVYSWTPTSSGDIYCAWISEIGMYLFHEAFGLLGLHVLRYLVILISVMLFVFYAYKRKIILHPIVSFSILIVAVTYGVSSASVVKPEMFSFLFMVLLVFLWWHIKNENGKRWWKVYIFPLIMVVWANTHGGFIFGYPFLGLIFLGDLLNLWLKSDESLPDKTRKHLIIAILLSGLSAFITPYGWNYPISLLTLIFTDSQEVERLRSIAGYTVTFSVFQFLIYFILMVIIFAYTLFISIKNRKVDWGFILMNVAYAILFTVFTRLVYYWLPVYVFSITYFLTYDEIPFAESKKIVRLSLSSFILIVSAVYVYFLIGDHLFKPAPYSWFGLGNSYNNAPEEAEYINKYLTGKRIGNNYDSGGYLLWKVGPKTKVMIDPRYFPYKKWYDEYYDYNSGKNVHKFLQKYNPEVLLVEYRAEKQLMEILRSPDWNLAMYGSGGVVFVHKDIPLPEGKFLHGKGVYDCFNAEQTLKIVQFSLVVRDFKVARKIIMEMREKLNRFPMERNLVKLASLFYNGYAHFYRNEFDKSLSILKKIERKTNFFNMSLGIIQSMYHFKTLELWNESKYNMALKYASISIDRQGNDIYGMYNIGMVGWYNDRKSDASAKNAYTSKDEVKKYLSERSWRDPLTRFIQLTKPFPSATIPRTVAEKVLAGQFSKKPFLISPPKPKFIDVKLINIEK